MVSIFKYFCSKDEVPGAHACNSINSEGRDQEVRSSKPAWANNSRDPILKILNTTKGWESGSSGRVPA
jgi:hypothetical protein